MIVCVNKPDNSVCFVVSEIEELDKYLFLEDRMYFVEMEPIESRTTTEDYADYFVIEGEWVHIDQLPEEYFDL